MAEPQDQRQATLENLEWQISGVVKEYRQHREWAANEAAMEAGDPDDDLAHAGSRVSDLADIREKWIQTGGDADSFRRALGDHDADEAVQVEVAKRELKDLAWEYRRLDAQVRELERSHGPGHPDSWEPEAMRAETLERFRDQAGALLADHPQVRPLEIEYETKPFTSWATEERHDYVITPMFNSDPDAELHGYRDGAAITAGPDLVVSETREYDAAQAALHVTRGRLATDDPREGRRQIEEIDRYRAGAWRELRSGDVVVVRGTAAEFQLNDGPDGLAVDVDYHPVAFQCLPTGDIEHVELPQHHYENDGPSRRP